MKLDPDKRYIYVRVPVWEVDYSRYFFLIMIGFAIIAVSLIIYPEILNKYIPNYYNSFFEGHFAKNGKCLLGSRISFKIAREFESWEDISTINMSIYEESVLYKLNGQIKSWEEINVSNNLYARAYIASDSKSGLLYFNIPRDQNLYGKQIKVKYDVVINSNTKYYILDEQVKGEHILLIASKKEHLYYIIIRNTLLTVEVLAAALISLIFIYLIQEKFL
jgi:hypothetical protein